MLSTINLRSLSFLGLFVSAAGLLISHTQTAIAGVIGSDDRSRPSYSWMLQNNRHAVGQLEVRKGDGLYYICTFTAIGPNIGLTNTHCLLDKQGRRPMQIKAFAVKHGTTVYAASNVQTFWTGRDSIPTTLGDYATDWAVIRFSDSNFTQRTGWFGNLGYFNSVNNAGATVMGQRTNLIGYSGDIQNGNVPSAHMSCLLQMMNSGAVLHNCDSTGGSSGTGMHNTTRQMQSLHAGERRLNGVTTHNIAVPLERFMPAVEALRRTQGSPNTRVPRV